ncbi:MAG: hypothetical protein DWQ31_11360 [Planctomycetota bacterium]|nr:MAG: hypothetical protein DWQ31_11360 [Planctomycetota bacterium]REJ94934.1 MAG: hypothetical protein DWQ35_07320 [Planctomycetota bacterium]REK49470.1 MAG: hypothetical protein DWQ46_00150 [Planctomycetota bacterium]
MASPEVTALLEELRANAPGFEDLCQTDKRMVGSVAGGAMEDLVHAILMQADKDAAGASVSLEVLESHCESDDPETVYLISAFLRELAGLQSQGLTHSLSLGPCLQRKLTTIAVDQAKADDLFRRVLNELPEVKPLYDRHLERFGYILPHELMSDLFDWYESELAESRNDRAELLLAILDEYYRRHDEEIEELISVSFLEYIAYRCPSNPSLLTPLPATLREQVDSILRGD